MQRDDPLLRHEVMSERITISLGFGMKSYEQVKHIRPSYSVSSVTQNQSNIVSVSLYSFCLLTESTKHLRTHPSSPQRTLPKPNKKSHRPGEKKKKKEEKERSTGY